MSVNARPRLRHARHVVAALLLWITIGGIPAANAAIAPQHGDTTVASLAALTIELHTRMLLHNDMTRFATVAAPNYVTMIPGGLLETKEQDMAGAGNFHIDSLTISHVETRANGATAVVTGTWRLVGRLGTQEMSGEYEFLSVYERAGDHWSLVAETITRRLGSLKAALTG